MLNNNQLSRAANGDERGEERPVPRAIIEVRNLRKEYPVEDETVVALDRVNLSIPQGQICCIFGESGSGKSTLLNQLAGMENRARRRENRRRTRQQTRRA